MSKLNDVFDAVRTLAQAVPGLYATIGVGAMPADSGISMAIATGAPSSTDINKGMILQFSVVLNGKSDDQREVSDALCNIHEALTTRTTYPPGDGWQITNISTTSVPSYIGRETNKQWLYGSSLRVNFYARS